MRRVPGAPGEPDKLLIPRRCSIDEFSFAAHVDGVENREFIEEVGAPVVVSLEDERERERGRRTIWKNETVSMLTTDSPHRSSSMASSTP